MNKRRLQSLGRKACIAVLLVTALLLLGETGYYAGVKNQFYPGTAEHAEIAVGVDLVNSARPAGSALPLAAVVCSPDGERCGAAYDEARVTEIFRSFSAMLGEALGSAGTPDTITEEAFQNDLLGCGVFLRFYCPQPLELLSAWLGAEMSGDTAAHSAELLLLCAGENGVTLCYRTEEQSYYRCSTEVSAEGLRSRTSEYLPNDVCFAFENPDISGGDSCTVIQRGSRAVQQAKCMIPQYSGSETDELLQAMGMNSFMTSSYAEADGTVVFLNDESILRMSPSGSLVFRRPAGYDTPEKLSLTDTVNLAWRLAEGSIGGTSGDGTLLFTGAVYNESQRSCTVFLDYAVNGIPVQLSSGHAAEIVLRGDTVIQARMQLCRFALEGEQQWLLPDLQAAAIAASEGTKAELRYAAGGETMNCVWVKSDG